jgi:hypothetical protein
MLNKPFGYALVFGALLGAGCMKKAVTGGGGAPAGGGGGGAAAAGPALGGTMADAPLYHIGASIDAPLKCNESGYAKFDFPVDQAVKMTVTIKGAAGTTVSASYLKASGGAVDGMMKQMDVDKNGSETWDIKGLDGGSFIQVLENPPCKGATISVQAQ